MKREKIGKKKKKILILFIILVLLFPFPIGNREGVVSSYKAVLYSYTTYRALDKEGEYYTTSEFLIFPFNFLY
ncbi:hypothetical protein WKS98_02525 [Lagierella sp. ICN-221743]